MRKVWDCLRHDINGVYLVLERIYYHSSRFVVFSLLYFRIFIPLFVRSINRERVLFENK